MTAEHLRLVFRRQPRHGPARDFTRLSTVDAMVAPPCVVVAPSPTRLPDARRQRSARRLAQAGLVVRYRIVVRLADATLTVRQHGVVQVLIPTCARGACASSRRAAGIGLLLEGDQGQASRTSSSFDTPSAAPPSSELSRGPSSSSSTSSSRAWRPGVQLRRRASWVLQVLIRLQDEARMSAVKVLIRGALARPPEPYAL